MMQYALIITLFCSGFVGKAVFDRYFGVRAAWSLVVRVFLFPFYVTHLIAGSLLQAAVWLATGEDPNHQRKLR